MSFFEPPPLSPMRERRPQPDWMGRPKGVVPGVVPVELVLARSEQAAVAIGGAWAYPTGMEFRLAVWERTEDPEVDDAIVSHWVVTTGPGPSDDLLRLGVQLADGRKATNLDRHDDDPAPPVLMQGGGYGNQAVWVCDYWLWPLPPAGPLAFVVEWPAQGVPETRAEIDAGPLRAAAERAVVLWPGQG